IYFEVDTFVWKLLGFMMIVILIPGVTAFVLTSLRKASSNVVNEKEQIRIVVRKLVKIYDRDSRFVREWKAGIKIRERAGLLKDYKHLRDFYDLIWQIPLFGFLVYFTFFYVNSSVWMWIMSHFIYFFLFLFYVPFAQVMTNRFEKTSNPVYPKINRIVRNVIFWGVPAFFLFLFFRTWDNLGMVIFVGIIWTLLLVIYSSGEYIHRKNLNIARIEGRFSALRRWSFTLVRQIPIIGKHKV